MKFNKKLYALLLTASLFNATIFYGVASEESEQHNEPATATHEEEFDKVTPEEQQELQQKTEDQRKLDEERFDGSKTVEKTSWLDAIKRKLNIGDFGKARRSFIDAVKDFRKSSHNISETLSNPELIKQMKTCDTQEKAEIVNKAIEDLAQSYKKSFSSVDGNENLENHIKAEFKAKINEIVRNVNEKMLNPDQSIAIQFDDGNEFNVRLEINTGEKTEPNYDNWTDFKAKSKALDDAIKEGNRQEKERQRLKKENEKQLKNQLKLLEQQLKTQTDLVKLKNENPETDESIRNLKESIDQINEVLGKKTSKQALNVEGDFVTMNTAIATGPTLEQVQADHNTVVKQQVENLKSVMKESFEQASKNPNFNKESFDAHFQNEYNKMVDRINQDLQQRKQFNSNLTAAEIPSFDSLMKDITSQQSVPDNTTNNTQLNELRVNEQPAQEQSQISQNNFDANDNADDEANKLLQHFIEKQNNG